ncbi:MAG: MOSC domain-containing protein [Solirubrobacteraceae bacterium]
MDLGGNRPSWNGRVVSLHVASEAAEPMIELPAVMAVAGRGIEGDRYFLHTGFYSHKPGPDRELTLIELETIHALRHENGIGLEPGEARRNVITEGVALNHLIERQFSVGDVIARGIRLCEPCTHLVEVTGRRVLGPLVHRGGLRAQILKGGRIRVDDIVSPLLESERDSGEPS